MDIYKINEQYTKHLLKWQCLSKLKLNSFENFYQTLLLLSGDIALNPGPVTYPCSKCSKGVRTSAVRAQIVKCGFMGDAKDLVIRLSNLCQIIQI